MWEVEARTERLEMIGSAAAGIAHDLNNQLGLILNHLAEADSEAARAAIVRCSELTGSLLSWCRGEAVRLKPLDSAAFLENFASKLRVPPDIRLAANIPAGLPLIAADAFALERVLYNLVSNSFGAMKNGGMLRISASPFGIDVSDSGPGIPKEVRARIFEPFFTTKGASGTGLGLAIVKEIMRQHGGSVHAHSEFGRGARFVLRFRPASTSSAEVVCPAA